MNQKTVIGLGLATVLTILVAVAITTARKPVTEPVQAYALPELRDHLNEVKAVTVTGAASRQLVTLERGDKGWIVKEKNGYPADVAKLRESLLKLADARLLQQKTATEQRYVELGVSDVKDPGAKGTLVSLQGLGQPAELIVGITNSQGGGTFVRRPGDKQSWLASGNLAFDKNPVDWVDKTLLDIAATRVREVTLRQPDGKILRVFKEQAGDTNFKVADVPKGRVLRSEVAANGLGTTLSRLTLEDVYPANEAEPPADRKASKARYVAFDGLVLDIEAWKQGEKHYARLTAEVDRPVAEAYIEAEQAKAKVEYEAQQKEQATKNEPKATESKAVDGLPTPAQRDSLKTPAPAAPLAVSDPAKDQQQRLNALDAEVAALKQRFAGWTFVLPAYKFSNLNQSMEDLLQPPGAKKSKR